MKISTNTWEVRTCRICLQSGPNFLLDEISAYAIVKKFSLFWIWTLEILLKTFEQYKVDWFSVVKECENENPCRHNATCIDLGEHQYECKCRSGFRGELCEYGEWKYLLILTLRLLKDTENWRNKQLVICLLIYVFIQLKRNVIERFVAVLMVQFGRAEHKLRHLSWINRTMKCGASGHSDHIDIKN